MKKITFTAVLILFFGSGVVMATVGGPTYISEIAYKAADNSVYYKVHDNGGRGCPPIINKINVNTGARGEVKTCDQLEQEDVHSEAGRQKYSQFMSDTYQGLPYMWSVSLGKNNISVKVKFIKAEMMEGFDTPVWREFEASITQDGKELGKINFRGCALDQPHVFEGYMVPGTDKMAMLISNKGDCFEGGYVKEALHVVKGVNYKNKEAVRTFKTESATEPNSGNLVVYASTDVTPTPTPNEPQENIPSDRNNSKIYLILVAVLGLGLGYFFARKRA